MSVFLRELNNLKIYIIFEFILFYLPHQHYLGCFKEKLIQF